VSDPTPKSALQVLPIRISPLMREALSLLAERRGVTVSELIRRALTLYLAEAARLQKRHKPQKDPQP
jgi:hypothetical protein